MIESRQSYCKESRVQFFWPTLYNAHATRFKSLNVQDHEITKSNHKNMSKWLSFILSAEKRCCIDTLFIPWVK